MKQNKKMFLHKTGKFYAGFSRIWENSGCLNSLDLPINVTAETTCPCFSGITDLAAMHVIVNVVN